MQDHQPAADSFLVFERSGVRIVVGIAGIHPHSMSSAISSASSARSPDRKPHTHTLRTRRVISSADTGTPGSSVNDDHLTRRDPVRSDTTGAKSIPPVTIRSRRFPGWTRTHRVVAESLENGVVMSTTVETAAEIGPFHVHVPEERIDDLRRRIAAAGDSAPRGRERLAYLAKSLRRSRAR
jgi:hypothetical protein